jgi:hypothetical protein
MSKAKPTMGSGAEYASVVLPVASSPSIDKSIELLLCTAKLPVNPTLKTSGVAELVDVARKMVSYSPYLAFYRCNA